MSLGVEKKNFYIFKSILKNKSFYLVSPRNAPCALDKISLMCVLTRKMAPF